MEKVIKVNCFMEEYKNSEDNVCVRLRDKITNKKVVITGENIDKEHFLRILSQAKINQYIMPTIFQRKGTDIVAVRGYKTSEDECSIVINIDCESGGYLFE